MGNNDLYVFTSNKGTFPGKIVSIDGYFGSYFGFVDGKYENHQHKLQLRIALVVKEKQFISCKYFLIRDH